MSELLAGFMDNAEGLGNCSWQQPLRSFKLSGRAGRTSFLLSTGIHPSSPTMPRTAPSTELSLEKMLVKSDRT